MAKQTSAIISSTSGSLHLSAPTVHYTIHLNSIFSPKQDTAHVIVGFTDNQP